MASDTDALWQALDEVRRKQEAHAVVHAEIGGRLDVHDTRFDAISQTLIENRQQREAYHNESKALLTDLKGKIETLTTEVTEARGAKKFGKWLIATLGISGLIAAVKSFWH